MRSAVVVVLAFGVVACGSGSSSPVAPTTGPAVAVLVTTGQPTVLATSAGDGFSVTETMQNTGAVATFTFDSITCP